MGRVSTLAELKTITFCQSYHFPGATKRGVELRGDALPAEYLRKARDTDRNFCNTAPDIQGPVETKLRSFPPLLKLVVGPFGECSGDLHELLNTLAESKTQYLSRSKGEPESEWKTASHLRGCSHITSAIGGGEAYLIIVTGTMGGARVKIFCQV